MNTFEKVLGTDKIRTTFNGAGYTLRGHNGNNW
jgi:hypothetical protein